MAEEPGGFDLSPVIVIFGAAVRPDGAPSQTLRRRVEAAVACGARQPTTLYVPTGGVGRFGPSEASVMAGLLEASGVARARILLEETGTSTLSSVRAVRRLLRAHALGGPVYAATSFYHLPRCLMLLRLAGIRARACKPPSFPASHAVVMRWYWRLREIPALMVDGALMVLLRGIGRV